MNGRIGEIRVILCELRVLNNICICIVILIFIERQRNRPHHETAGNLRRWVDRNMSISMSIVRIVKKYFSPNPTGRYFSTYHNNVVMERFNWVLRFDILQKLVDVAVAENILLDERYRKCQWLALYIGRQ